MSLAAHPFSKRLKPAPALRTGPHQELARLTLMELAALLDARSLSSRELTQAYLDRIDALDGAEGLNAFITLAPEQVLDAAEAADRARGRCEHEPALLGIPLAFKDAFDTADLRSTGGMKVLENRTPVADATVVAALRRAGAIVLGKTNLHEAGFGITSNNPHFGAVRNPCDPQRIPGGSSGGSAAATAAGLCAAALGTDTGGSVRIPPALCGGVGLKPTRGRVSRGGMLGLSWTCDVNGPITRSVADAALLLESMCVGPDSRDPVACWAPAGATLPRARSLPRDASALRGLRVGIAGGYFANDNDPRVDACMQDAAAELESAGARLTAVEVRDVELGLGAGFEIVVPEAVLLTEACWRAFDPGLRIEDEFERLGEDVRTVFAAERGPGATPVPASVYLDALTNKRAAVQAGFAAALAGVDVLLTPATPAPAVRFEEDRIMQLNGSAHDTFATFIRYTFGVSLAGLPAIVVPGGQTEDGLPLALQFVGHDWAERTLIEVAHAWEMLNTG